MERVRYPWWISPFFALMAVAFFIPALGGPGPILAATLSGQQGLAAVVCLTAGVLVMGAVEWWSRRIFPPQNLAAATKRGNRRLIFLIVLTAGGLILVRSGMQSPPSLFRAVVLGLFSGILLGEAIFLPFDKRRRVPFDVPSQDRRA